MPTAPSSPPISAPDLIGPVSFLRWPTRGGRRRRSGAPGSFRFVRVEVDLRHERLVVPTNPLLQRFESLLQEQFVVEEADLLRMTGLVLHSLSAVGYRTVLHWEVRPGGWLPLPEPGHRGSREPVGHLLRALGSPRWRSVASAREFAIRLSGPTGTADVTARRVHRERGHSVTVELHGRLRTNDVHGVVDALRGRLPVLRARVADFTRG